MSWPPGPVVCNGRVSPHVSMGRATRPLFGRQLCGLPSSVELLSPPGALLPLVYGTTASALWLELRGHSAWQATLSWTVHRLACHRLLPWLRVTFSMVPDAAWPGSDQWPWSTAAATGPVGRLGRPSVSDPSGVGSFLSLGRPMCVRCPGPLGSSSRVHLLGALRCNCLVLGHLAPVHRCARSVRCFACAVSGATWLLFTGVRAWFVLLRLRCPEPLGSCSPVRPLGVLCCFSRVLGHLAPVHRCARRVCCVVCVVSWVTWLLFTGVPAWFVVLRLRCPGPLGSCLPVRLLGVLCCACGVLGDFGPVPRCARLVRCVACAVSWATWLLFTGVPAPSVALLVRCFGPLGFCSPVCPLRLLFCLCGVLGHLVPVHRCTRSVCCVVCEVSLATWHLFTCVLGRGVPPFCFPQCMCVCGVLANVAPVHRCARCVRCACAVGSCVPLPPPLIFFSVFVCFSSFFVVPPPLFFLEKRGRRHRHGQLVQRCNSVLFSGVCRRCFVGRRAPGVRLTRPDVHGYGSGQVWFVASLLLVLAG